MSDIQGFAAHAAGAQLLPFRYDPGELGALRSRGPHHPLRHLPQRPSPHRQRLGHQPVSVHPRPRNHRHRRRRRLRRPLPNVGQRVGLGWQSNSCGICEWCRRGEENLCPKAQATCVHRHGGYADRVRVNARFVIPIPDALDSDTAAPLLCGGITVYNPLRNHGVNPSSRVGVVGIGGLGHLAIQFARVFGAEVTAFSTSADKEEEARALGAHHFVNTRETSS